MTRSHTPQAAAAALLRSTAVGPAAHDPSITAPRVQNLSAPIALFGDDRWPMQALDHVGARQHRALTFTVWDPQFRQFAKHVAYALINHGAPAALLDKRAGSYVAWPSPATIRRHLDDVRTSITWLTGPWSHAHPLTPLRAPGDLDQHHLEEVRRWLERAYPNPTTRRGKLEALVRVWNLNPALPQHCQFPEPRWLTENWQPRQRPGENRTARLTQATMGPLLEWALAFVTTFADDILTAHEHFRATTLTRTGRTRASDRETCRRILQEHRQHRRALPADPRLQGSSYAERIGWAALAHRHGVDVTTLAHTFYRWDHRDELTVSPDLAFSALDELNPAALFHGRPWIPLISYYDLDSGHSKAANGAGPLMAHLRTACLIVIAYLTGARPGEVRALGHGAAPEPELLPGGARLHLIHGHVAKGVLADSDGAPVQARPCSWATIEAGTTAVRVAERVSLTLGHQEDLIFAQADGRLPDTTTMTRWISQFVDFVNDRLVPTTATPGALHIPPDPTGAITLSRFRRTLAWFLRNRPDGEVTTAIQYQHLGTALSAGYAGTQHAGLNDLLLEEDWSHRKRTLQHLHDLLADGTTLSGPAAGRAAAAARKLPRQLTPGDERRLKRDPTTVVYDNPAALALCVYDEQRALCQTANAANTARPNLIGCIDGCPNTARTPAQLTALVERAAAMRRHATHAALPLARSLQAQAAQLEQTAAAAGHIGDQPGQRKQ